LLRRWATTGQKRRHFIFDTCAPRGRAANLLQQATTREPGRLQPKPTATLPQVSFGRIVGPRGEGVSILRIPLTPAFPASMRHASRFAGMLLLGNGRVDIVKHSALFNFPERYSPSCHDGRLHQGIENVSTVTAGLEACGPCPGPLLGSLCAS
jgi:hypothetical protein